MLSGRVGGVGGRALLAAIVAKLNAEVGKIASHPEIAKAWKAQGATLLVMGVPGFARCMNDDIAKWAHIVKVSGARVDP